MSITLLVLFFNRRRLEPRNLLYWRSVLRGLRHRWSRRRLPGGIGRLPGMLGHRVHSRRGYRCPRRTSCSPPHCSASPRTTPALARPSPRSSRPILSHRGEGACAARHPLALGSFGDVSEIRASGINAFLWPGGTSPPRHTRIERAIQIK